MKTSTLIFTAVLSAGFMFENVAPLQAAEADNHGVVHDSGGHIVRNTFGNCVRTRWDAGTDECQKKQRVQRVVHHPIIEAERTAYFQFNKANLMDNERLKLDTLANTLKSTSDIKGVSIVGYADRIGTTGYNERLSERRAKSVEKYLRDHGYLNTTVAKTRWYGESEPITHCANDLSHSDLVDCLQKDRRVTVEIMYEDELLKTNK